MGKNPLTMQETQVQSLSQEDPLEKGMAIHSSILGWRVPGTEESGAYSSRGHKKSDMIKWPTHIEDRGSRVSSIKKGIFDRLELKSVIEVVNFKRS